MIIDLKVLGQAFFKRLAGQGRSPVADRSQRKAPLFVRSEMGELKNNPVDYFLRGKALQERAFPSNSKSE